MPYSSDDLFRLVQDEHTRQVIDLEKRIGVAAVGDSDTLFAELIRRTLAAWTHTFGGPDQAATAGDLLRRIIAAARAAIRRILDALAPRATAALEGALAEALTLGARQGIEFARAASGRRRPAPKLTPGRALRGEARRLVDVVVQRRDRALFLLHPDRVTRWTHLLTGLAAGRAAVSATRGHIAWVVGTAVNEGLDTVTRAVRGVRLWVSEADACVRCLAYTGRSAPVGEPFPGGLSWDPRQRRTSAPAVDGPPLHGHCRCRTVPWREAWTADGVPFPLALRREAHRSLAYGVARPSESRAARLRAVRELLRTEPDLLPAVEARARTALRTGQFATAA
ncbi:hypothetical protein [Streptomyces canus]|uniref:hypothetical protein n=1 Tax=Streptomyces canus TaxID=58343 RepID=UPI00278716D0|nr:hypothetical protein [Streptomyces canus]MDQ0758704.1 hypothetical protein [Streptomyces canus]